jgi:dihydroorotase
MRVDGWGLYEGSPADLTVFDSAHEWTFNVGQSRSLSRNSPFDGWKLKGRAMATIVGGRIVYEEHR